MMRTLDDLINREDPGWPIVLEWIGGARNKVEILPTLRERGEQTLLGIQVTSRSPLGAIALETGGLWIDGGWIRILGAGCDRQEGSLLSWNGLADFADAQGLRPDALPGAFVIAHDVVGGFYAMNGGAFDGPRGNVFYFAMDSLEWMDCEKGYSDFLWWALHADFDAFYRTEREHWPDWREAIACVTGDQGVHHMPPLWTKEGKTSKVDRKVVSMVSIWRMYVNGPEWEIREE